MTDIIVSLVMLAIFGCTMFYMWKYLIPKDPPDANP